MRHTVKPDSRTSQSMKELLETLLSHVSSSLKAPVFKALREIDFRSKVVRMGESAGGDWIADIVRHSYDATLCLKGCGGADGVLIAAGTLRSDAVYGPGTCHSLVPRTCKRTRNVRIHHSW